MPIIRVTITVDVHTPAALIEAARQQRADAGDDEASILEMIPDGDAAAALCALLENEGIDVVGSHAEILTTHASSPGAAVRSEDCSVSFEREG